MPTKPTPERAYASATSTLLSALIAYRAATATARQERVISARQANSADDMIETARASLGDGVGLTVTAPISHVAIAACDCGDRHYPHCKRAPGDMAL